eukprot:TRINITY_DN100453_c0_g1_i1.p1 TRINITY_DN100453_c0_g1~~TRINITY_DN100453_c0_g1_i1.p1  ORF type:complete len:463 (-),score=103.19 TRINITY_DN100453_c0_g1_i1:129-1457(-)
MTVPPDAASRGAAASSADCARVHPQQDVCLKTLQGEELDDCQPGDAPSVRDQLIKWWRDPALEVEGKLGRRSKDRFRSGVSQEQFAALEAFLSSGGGCSSSSSSDWQCTVDRFHATEEEAAAPKGRQKKTAGEVVRASFECDACGSVTKNEPLEVLRKTRLADCHVARRCEMAGDQDSSGGGSGIYASSLASPVDLRVSFSRESNLPPAAIAAEFRRVVYERRKMRRSWHAKLWQVVLTKVRTSEPGCEAKGVDTFEVEVELKMDVVRNRMEDAASSSGGSPKVREEALLITREFVGGLRDLAASISGIEHQPSEANKKRLRQEAQSSAEPSLRASAEEPDIAAELRRRVRPGAAALAAGGECGPAGSQLHGAKMYLQEALQAKNPALQQDTIFKFAGQHVARVLRQLLFQLQQEARVQAKAASQQGGEQLVGSEAAPSSAS